jgi:hypothetical protein
MKIPAAPYREQTAFYYKGKWIMICKEKKGCLLWKHYGTNKHNVGEEHRVSNIISDRTCSHRSTSDG